MANLRERKRGVEGLIGALDHAPKRGLGRGRLFVWGRNFALRQVSLWRGPRATFQFGTIMLAQGLVTDLDHIGDLIVD